MNAVSLLFHKVGTGAPVAVAISPIARAVKDELERRSDGCMMRRETHEDVAALYLDGFSDAEAAAELYPGMLLFESHEFSHHGLLAREYTSILGIYCQRVLVGSDDWELSEDAYLNTLRVAEQLAPNVFLGTAGASKFLNPVVERAAATGKTELIDAIAAVSNAAVLSEAQDSGYMHDYVEKWLKAIGLSTDAILKDLVAGLLEERRQIVDAATAPLDSLIERVLDNEISFYKLTKGRYAEFDAVVGTSPQKRGQALQYLLDLVVDEGQCRNFNYLGRRNGRWPHQCGGWEKPGVHLDQLAAILARFVHTLDDRDATHAKLIVVLKQINTAYSAPSPLVLRELLKTVAQHPDGRTVQALRVLIQMAAYASWRYPLEKMLAKTAPNDLGHVKLPLELPEWTIGKYQAADNFAGHYANLFEPQLYADPHDTYIRRVVAVYPKLYEAQESGTGKEDLKHLLAAELERAGLASALEPEDDMTWFEAIDFLQSGARLFVLREALRPMAEKYPDVLKELSELVATLTIGATPSDKWLRFARNIFDRMAPSDWLQGLEGITQHDAPEHSVHGSRGEPYVRALIYIGSHLPAADVGPVLAQYALKKCYVTEPGVGIRSEKLGNACVWALANLPDGGGVPYLARILARTKYPKIRTKIEAELNRAAAMAGISRVNLDEASVPTHDLDRDGKRTVQFYNGSATLITKGNSARIEWANAAGKPVKAATTAMKQEKDLLEKVRADLKELQSDLSIQPQRLQKLYLLDRSWSVNEWRERYFEHPLMRGFARRLVWLVVSESGASVPALPDNAGEVLLSLSDDVVALDKATICLWHPMDGTAKEIEAWRDRLEELKITQPFAQVWREIYALTDAERATGTYSNRWAGHILKQHQTMTLARINGWNVTARVGFDAPNDAPWHLHMPAFGLVAEYWVEGAGGDEPETSETGAYSLVNTDRVTFFRADEGMADSAYGPSVGDALPLADIPPIVFSEVMRSCDLFTAVASIAADPGWLDRGHEAAHPSQWGHEARRYWENINTGELVESGVRRRAILERIVPRLAIADKLTLTDKALVVKGTRHTYEIHLGSGASSRGGRHICIIPNNSSIAAGKIWLPFEGDRTLSIIISKAVLLAADDKITDPVILAQI